MCVHACVCVCILGEICSLLENIDKPHKVFSDTVPHQSTHAIIISTLGTSLVVQWLRLCTSNAGGLGSIPGSGND